jgi:tetratricopeptide (TPR) repeat protein
VDDRPEHPELFISYASGDLARAAALHARLAAEGFRVWFDRVRLTPGCDWHKEIEAGCDAGRVMLPLITPRWANSEWTRYETYAHAAVIPVLAEGRVEDVMPPPLRRWNAVLLDPLAVDAAVWQTLLAAIRAKLAEPAPERASRIVDLPYPANPFFTGRDDDLVRIHEELHTAPVAALTQGRVRALASMGGIGKTTLANEYARRYWRLYPQILWVDARAGLESGFALLFGKLFPDRSDAGLQQPDKAKLVLAELSGRAERLLVLDNVSDAESVRPWLPRDPTTGCRTLITSRFADWSAVAGIGAIQLDVLEPEPARQFMLTRTRRTAEGAERVACDDLARSLGYLPLALEQAAAYIAAPGAGVDFVGYLRLYREATAELLARRALGSTEYPDPVITTWQATVANLSPESRAVLRLCAWYADTPIPRALVMGGAEEVLALAVPFGPVAPLSGAAGAELRIRDALTGLACYSMILGATDTTFRVHGLVQAVEQMHAEAEGAAAQARELALTRLTDLFPRAYDDPVQWPLCRLLLPHQQVLLTRTFPDSAAERATTLLNLTGSFLRSTGDAAGALPLLRRAFDGCERVLGPEHPDTLTGVSNLAGCLEELGGAARALPLHRRALDGCERVLGPEHPDTLNNVHNLASCLQALGDAAGALPLCRRALDGRERLLGPKHRHTLSSVSNLASCVQARGDAAEALPLHVRALDGRECVLGPEHPDTLNSVNNLAFCRRALGDVEGALPLYRRAFDSCERVLGPEHPNTLITVSNLAFCLQASDDAAAALPLYRRALDSCQRVLGAEHPETVISVSNLASCLEALGDAAGALPLHQRALECRERVLGSQHPSTLISLDNLAGCLRVLGDAARALPLHRRALDGRERVLGPEHPDTLVSVSNLAMCLQTLGDAAALPLFRRALVGRQRVLGPEHPDTLNSVTHLAFCLQALGNPAEALSLYRRAVSGFDSLFGPEHPSSRTVRDNCDRLEREVAAARGRPLRQTRATKAEIEPGAKPWWRRLFG